jgi:hypothetical protein
MEELYQSSLNPHVAHDRDPTGPPTLTGSSGKYRYSTEEIANQMLIKLFVCFRWIHLPLHAVQGVQPEPERGVVPQADWWLDIARNRHQCCGSVFVSFRIWIQFFPQCGFGSATKEPNQFGSIQIGTDLVQT